MKTLLAFDPGVSGGIAVRHHDGSVTCHKMPETTKDLCNLIANANVEAVVAGMSVNLPSAGVQAYVEEVSGFAGSAQPGSRMFNFGQGFGEIRGILTAFGIPFEMIKPARWQKALGLGHAEHIKGDRDLTADGKKNLASTNGRLKREWKAKLKARAQEWFPDQSVTLCVSDALLLLKYAEMREVPESDLTDSAHDPEVVRKVSVG